MSSHLSAAIATLLIALIISGPSLSSSMLWPWPTYLPHYNQHHPITWQFLIFLVNDDNRQSQRCDIYFAAQQGAKLMKMHPAAKSFISQCLCELSQNKTKQVWKILNRHLNNSQEANRKCCVNRNNRDDDRMLLQKAWDWSVKEERCCQRGPWGGVQFGKRPGKSGAGWI